MGQAELKKATLLLYNGEKEDFLKELQNLEIFHISNSRASTLAEEYPELIPEEDIDDEEGREILNELEDVIEALKPYSGGKGILEQFIDLKLTINLDRYATVVKTFNRDEIKKVYQCHERKYHLQNKLISLEEKRDFYREWKDLKTPLSEIYKLDSAVFKAYKIKANEDELNKLFEDLPVDFTIVFRNQKVLGCIFIIYRGFESKFDREISNFEYESVDFRGEEKSPESILDNCNAEIEEIEGQLEDISNWIREKSKNFENYLILHDYFNSRVERTTVLNRSLMSSKVFFIEGWLDEADCDKFNELTGKYSSVDIKWTQPREGEFGPVKLDNNRASEPYEALTALYAYPKSSEVDPSPYIALFFALFFGFCLTDIIYGFALIAISFFLLPRLPEGRKYLWIFIVGGILTVIAGALTGGWLGVSENLFSGNTAELNPIISGVLVLRKKFMVFDPFENPLNFLKLSLVFGGIQIGTGLVISAREKMKKREYLDAAANEISWMVFFAIMGTGFITGNQKLYGAAVLPLLMILLFSWRSNAIWKQIFKGTFTLFKDGVGFLGDILSYSRIMALGLVTAGLAMSINVLVMLLGDMIPFVGPILAVFVFIIGHVFSLAINTLSGFVHTMRLQFAEFFSYFYEGGGEKFTPFGFKGKYIRLDEKKEV